jgi:hypothetical protein
MSVEPNGRIIVYILMEWEWRGRTQSWFLLRHPPKFAWSIWRKSRETHWYPVAWPRFEPGFFRVITITQRCSVRKVTEIRDFTKTPWILIDLDESFKGICCHHLETGCPEDEGGRSLRTIIKIFITCTLLRVQLEWSSQGGWDGQGMQREWGRKGTHIR